MGIFDKFRKDKTEEKAKDQIQPIIPIDDVIGFELVFVASTFSNNEREGLKQSWEPILCKAWPMLFPLLLDRNPKMRFTVAFVSSPEEANAHIKSSTDKLSANVVIQFFSIQIAVPQENMRDYGITLALYMPCDTGSDMVVVLASPDHTLAPGKWINPQSAQAKEAAAGSRSLDYSNKIKKCINCGLEVPNSLLQCPSCGSDRYAWE